MARTPAQRGPFGRWLTRVRTERYERQVDALADMRRLAGLHISQAEFSQWESGSRVPRPDNPKVARLYEFFGSRPEDGETGPPQGEAGLGALVSALQGFVEELREDRRMRQEQIGTLLREIAAERLARREWEAAFLKTWAGLATDGEQQDDPASELPLGVPVGQGR